VVALESSLDELEAFAVALELVLLLAVEFEVEIPSRWAARWAAIVFMPVARPWLAPENVSAASAPDDMTSFRAACFACHNSFCCLNEGVLTQPKLLIWNWYDIECPSHVFPQDITDGLTERES
jgi:hypothetical protein